MFPHPRYRCQIWLCRTRLLRTRISWPLRFRPARQHSGQPIETTIGSNVGHEDGSRVDGEGGHTMPMNGANLGDSSESAMITASLFCSGVQAWWVGKEDVSRQRYVSAGWTLRFCRGRLQQLGCLLQQRVGRVLLMMMMMKLEGELLRCRTTPGRVGCQEQPDHV